MRIETKIERRWVMRAAIVALALGLGATLGATLSEDTPDLSGLPKPTKEHEWLDKLAGEWTVNSKITHGEETIEVQGTETARRLGGFWLIADSKGELFGTELAAQLTIGFDPEKKKFVGTWIDSVSSYLWHYEGSLDSAGKILTLETEGPCPAQSVRPTTKFREVFEVKDADHKTFTSSYLADDGTWTKMITSEFRRKKKE